MSDSPEMQTVNKMVLGGTNNDLVKGFHEMNECLKNPFQIIFYWVKSQISDLKAMREALVSRENVIGMCHKIRQKKQQTQKELQACSDGKTTLKTFFKGANETKRYQEDLTRQIKILDNTETSYEKLAIILEIELMKFCGVFKKQKIDDFTEIVREMSQVEVENSNHGANFWSKLLSDPKLTPNQNDRDSIV